MAVNEEFDLGIDAPVETPAPKKAPKAPKPAQRHRIFVAEDENGLGYITVGVDGVVSQIQCGVEVEVSAGVLGVLREAVATKYHKAQGPDGKDILVARDSPTIPFQYLGPVGG
jgi:hypothetical protein